MEQHNQYNGECCTGSDVVILGDNEWRTNGDHYEAFHNGTWFTIEPWMLTQRHDNRPATRSSGSGMGALLKHPLAC